MAAGLDAGRDEAQFLRWFDLMGVQRHLKVGGIFARLWHRDGKPGYLADIPRTLTYAVGSCARHADFAALGDPLSDACCRRSSRSLRNAAPDVVRTGVRRDES